MAEDTPRDAEIVAAAAKRLREHLAHVASPPLLAALADWWEAAGRREIEAHVGWDPRDIGDPQPGDEIHAAVHLARVYLEGRA